MIDEKLAGMVAGWFGRIQRGNAGPLSRGRKPSIPYAGVLASFLAQSRKRLLIIICTITIISNTLEALSHPNPRPEEPDHVIFVRQSGME